MTNNETLLYEAVKQLIEALTALRNGGAHYNCNVCCSKQADEALTKAKVFIELIEP